MRTFTDFLSHFRVEDLEDGEYLCICPAHNDHKPSLVIGKGNNGKVVLTCRAGCRNEAIMKAANLDSYAVEWDDPEIVEQEKSAPVGMNERAELEKYLSNLTDDDIARDYAARRFGVTDELFDRFGLGYDDGAVESGELPIRAAQWTPRFVIPFRDFTGEPHYSQGRAIDPEFKGERWMGPANIGGLSWGRYGWFDMGATGRSVIITEGPGDALVAAGLGYDAVAIRGAGVVSDDLGRELAAGLSGRSVIVSGDNDEGGAKFIAAVRKVLPGVEVLAIPEDVNDLADWYARGDINLTKTREVREEVVSVAPAKIEWKKLRLPSTEGERAKLILEHIQATGRDIRWTPEAGWLIWAGSTWELVPDEKMVKLPLEIADNLFDAESHWRNEAKNAREDEDESKKLEAKVKAFHTAYRAFSSLWPMRAALEVLKGQVYANITEFDCNLDVLGVKNGVVELKTGTLRPYRREDYITQAVPFDYREDAQSDLWDHFLVSTFVTEDDQPDAIMVDFSQRLVGYGITGYDTEHVLPVLWGKGGNGKSVFTETLTHVFEPISHNTPFSTFEEHKGDGANEALADLRNARLVFASEGEMGKYMAEATIKNATGGTTIRARELYHKGFEFRPKFLIMLATNYKPNFRGQDDGLWRRVKLIGFHHSFEHDPAKDEKLGQKLEAKEHSEAVLAWAVKGAREWYKRGLAIPATVKQSTEDYRQEQDSLGDFIFDTYLVTGNDKEWIPVRQAQDDYVTWAQEHHEERKLPRKLIGTMLAERPGIKRGMRRGQSILKGLRKLTDTEIAERNLMLKTEQEIDEIRQAETFPVHAE